MGISAYQKLVREFNDKVKILQENCKHEYLTSWKELQWAPGHTTTQQERRCRRCNKITHKKYVSRVCNICSYMQPWYMLFCPKCNKEDSRLVEVYERYGKIVNTKPIEK